MSHTPGPWHVCNTDYRAVEGPGGLIVADIRSSAFESGREDAALVAAAPDLLAFAESVVTIFAKEYPQAGLHLDMDKASLLNAAREAIKKARDK